MPLPTSGNISLTAVAAELGFSGPVSLGDSRLLNLAGKPGPGVSLSDFYGKSAVGPLMASGVNDFGYGDSRFGSGSVSCSPSVNVSGGSGTRSFQWSIVSSNNGPTLSNVNSQSCLVSRAFTNNATGAAQANLRCIVSDATGSVTVNNILADLQWEGNA